MSFQLILTAAAAAAQQVVAPGMDVGMNLSWITSWAGSVIFSNVLYQSTGPEQISGSGAWTHDRGRITASVQTDKFRLKWASVDWYLPEGTYTVLNPSGCNLAVGVFSDPGDAQYTTATQFTFTLTKTGQSKSLFVKGSMPGNVQIILPGHLASWQAGNIWSSDILSFYSALNLKYLRFMDAVSANTSAETEWSDRNVPGGTTLYTPYGQEGNVMPHEFVCDLANRLGVTPWIHVPVRASASYVAQMAAFYKANLSPGLKVHPVFGNEVWNTATVFNSGTNWVTYLNYTKRTATADVPNQRFNYAGHGLTNGQSLLAWSTAENAAARSEVHWRFLYGVGGYAKVIDANIFEVCSDAALTAKINVAPGMVNMVFVNPNEAGKTPSMNGNYGAKTLEIWDAFDAEFGASRVIHAIESMAAFASHTAGRLAVPGVSDRVDHVAIAPYFAGAWCGGAITVGDGTITPAWWSSLSNTVHIAAYASGSTPSDADVLAGTGAISKQVLSYSGGANTYTSATPVSGLANGTTYDVHYLFTENGTQFRLKGSATPSATASTTYVYDTPENQALRHNLDTVYVGAAQVMAHAAVLPARAKVVCYEGGLHFHHDAPAQMKTWLASYQETQQFADAILFNLKTLAAYGTSLHCYYADVLGTTFSIATTYSDTSDRRYLTFTGLSGRVAKPDKVDFSDVIGAPVLTQPAYPAGIHTFADASYTYRVSGGDTRNQFDFSGPTLRLLNGSGLDYGSPSVKTIYIEASKGGTSDFFSFSVSIGDAWYSSESKFAWNSAADTDGTEINPIIGSAIPRTFGATLPPIAGGMWDMDGLCYSGVALTANAPLNVPTLIAIVLDRDNHTAAFEQVAQFGVNPFVGFRVPGAGLASFGIRFYNNGDLASLPFGVSTGKHVCWAYLDGVNTLTSGYDQTNGASATVSFASLILGREVTIGGIAGADKMKHGSAQLMQRVGMTLADAKVIVAKMQVLHGIP